MSACISGEDRTLAMLPIQYDECCRRIGGRFFGASIKECFSRAVEKLGVQRANAICYYKLEHDCTNEEPSRYIRSNDSKSRQICVTFWEIA